jgi:hypothetical protein
MSVAKGGDGKQELFAENKRDFPIWEEQLSVVSEVKKPTQASLEWAPDK